MHDCVAIRTGYAAAVATSGAAHARPQSAARVAQAQRLRVAAQADRADAQHAHALLLQPQPCQGTSEVLDCAHVFIKAM